jgi:hypothetical protein
LNNRKRYNKKVIGVVPDLSAFGKSMGNGFAVSALVGKSFEIFDGDVSIKLYDRNELIQNISSRTVIDGVYKCKPRISVKSGYYIRFYSWKYQNIFGRSQL